MNVTVQIDVATRDMESDDVNAKSEKYKVNNGFSA